MGLLYNLMSVIKKFLSVIICLFFTFSFAQVRMEKMKAVKTFLSRQKKYNQDWAIFIDFKIPSHKPRFFIYNFMQNTVIESGLVAHGSGSVVAGSSALVFSNTPNSHQSSLGRYEVIKKSYVGQFGKAYRLKGLDETNSNAMKRAIVLHAYHCVPDKESQKPICLSLGCPMLSQNFFNTVALYIDASEKPVLMYIYY